MALPLEISAVHCSEKIRYLIILTKVQNFVVWSAAANMRIDSVSAVVINKQIGGHNNDIIRLNRR